jgi:hypothetical protein
MLVLRDVQRVMPDQRLVRLLCMAILLQLSEYKQAKVELRCINREPDNKLKLGRTIWVSSPLIRTLFTGLGWTVPVRPASRASRIDAGLHSPRPALALSSLDLKVSSSRSPSLVADHEQKEVAF